MNNNRRGGTTGRNGNSNSRKKNDGGNKPFDGRKEKPGAPNGDRPVRKAAFVKGKGPKPFETKQAKPKVETEKDEIRLNKYIANSGMCSRRDADIYIQSGNVKVNGEVVTEMGYKVKLTDVVEFDGTRITPEKKEYLLLNKPKSFSTTGESDAKNAFDLIQGASKANLQPVGRMDKNTTGLILFTNDSDLLRKFSQPNQKSFKIYQVSLSRTLKAEDFEKIKGGVTLDGHRLFIDEISFIDNQPKSEIGLKLRTPNVKVVRAIFESFGYDVLKVDRVMFAGLTKKNLPRGNYRFLTDQEIINIRNAQ
ncbi:pseudouridine synthase [Flavobacterium sp. RNTU_13]|uniref:pseudouridine synthase n=1 Tax=Flavobacterium sp. RNTU_13 TaxID=3375145 RepID=UPI003985E18D